MYHKKQRSFLQIIVSHIMQFATYRSLNPSLTAPASEMSKGWPQSEVHKKAAVSEGS